MEVEGDCAVVGGATDLTIPEDFCVIQSFIREVPYALTGGVVPETAGFTHNASICPGDW